MATITVSPRATSQAARQPGPSALPERLLSWRIAAILLPIVLFGGMLRLLMGRSFQGGDDSTYIRDAYLLAHGQFAPAPTQWDVRIGIIAPIALALHLFGLHDWSVALYPLLTSLLSILLIYLLGATLFKREVGLLAALILACFPQDIFYATSVFPDQPGAFYGALAVLLALWSKRTPAKTALALACGAGLALSAAYLTRETYVLFVPVCLLATWNNRHHRESIRRAAVVAAVPAITFLLECLVYHQLTGSFLFRLAALHHHTALLRGTTLLHFVLRWPLVLLNPGYPQTYFYTIATIWALMTLYRRGLRAEERFLMTWLIGTWAVLLLAVISVHPLVALLEVEPRYLSGVSYAAILLIAAALWHSRPRGWDSARKEEAR